MALIKHSTSLLDGSTSDFTDREVVGVQYGVANVIGGSAGASVSTVVTFLEPLPASYGVWIGHHQDATAYITTPTLYGFTVVLNPLLAANTLAVGTFDVLVVA